MNLKKKVVIFLILFGCLPIANIAYASKDTKSSSEQGSVEAKTDQLVQWVRLNIEGKDIIQFKRWIRMFSFKYMAWDINENQDLIKEASAPTRSRVGFPDQIAEVNNYISNAAKNLLHIALQQAPNKIEQENIIKKYYNKFLFILHQQPETDFVTYAYILNEVANRLKKETIPQTAAAGTTAGSAGSSEGASASVGTASGSAGSSAGASAAHASAASGSAKSSAKTTPPGGASLD